MIMPSSVIGTGYLNIKRKVFNMSFDLGEFFKLVLMIVVAVPVVAVSVVILRAALTGELTNKDK